MAIPRRTAPVLLLWLTAALFGLYLVLVVVGYRAWRATLLAHD